MPAAQGGKGGEVFLGVMVWTGYVKDAVVRCSWRRLKPQLCPEHLSEGASKGNVLACFICMLVDFTDRGVHDRLAEQISSALDPSMYHKPDEELYPRRCTALPDEFGGRVRRGVFGLQ